MRSIILTLSGINFFPLKLPYQLVLQSLLSLLCNLGHLVSFRWPTKIAFILFQYYFLSSLSSKILNLGFSESLKKKKIPSSCCHVICLLLKTKQNKKMKTKTNPPNNPIQTTTTTKTPSSGFILIYYYPIFHCAKKRKKEKKAQPKLPNFPFVVLINKYPF